MKKFRVRLLNELYEGFSSRTQVKDIVLDNIALLIKVFDLNVSLKKILIATNEMFKTIKLLKKTWVIYNTSTHGSSNYIYLAKKTSNNTLSKIFCSLCTLQSNLCYKGCRSFGPDIINQLIEEKKLWDINKKPIIN